MAKTALVIRHLAFEDLGALQAPLEEAGYEIVYADMGLYNLALAPDADLLVILGGPISAYDDAIYPFLKAEIAFIAARLKAAKPTFGICLGAQLMARALGARVYPGRTKEIGWSRLTLRPGAELLRAVADDPVLHWHGDTFDLPEGAMNLASTPDCEQQAFLYGRHALALQFHPEVFEPTFERWLIGFAGEIAATEGISAPSLRADMKAYGARSAANGQALFSRWLADVT